MEDENTYYRRHLPHFQPQEAIYHVIFRLAGSLPKNIFQDLKEENHRLKGEHKKRKDRLYNDKFDTWLNRLNSGELWLRKKEIAELVEKAIKFRDGKEYDLLAYCIMPNHVHIVFELPECARRDSIPTYRVTKIIGSLKKFTAIRANRILKRSGPFWQHESYDHVINDANELENTIWYVLYNPVNAGLATEWDKWNWLYCKKEYLSH